MYIRRNISSRVIYMQIEIQVIHYKVNVKGNEFQKLFSIQITVTSVNKLNKIVKIYWVLLLKSEDISLKFCKETRCSLF